MDKRAKMVIAGAAASFALLVALLILRWKLPAALELEPRWLLAAGLPLLIALLVAGYVGKLKVPGAEIESPCRSSPSPEPPPEQSGRADAGKPRGGSMGEHGSRRGSEHRETFMTYWEHDGEKKITYYCRESTETNEEEDL